MDQIRNFGNQNRSLIVNGIYIVAVAIIVYYLFQFYLGTSSGLSLEGNKQTAVGLTEPKVYEIHNGTDESTRDRRIMQNGKYTFCAWFYLNGPQPSQTKLLTLNEQPTAAGSTSTELLSIGLYPGTNKMFIRSRTSSGTGTIDVTANSADVALPMCDVVDVDYQRWIQVTVVVNGRIMDVYMDGKLARSCVLPAGQYIVNSDRKSRQAAAVYAFQGFYSGLYFMSEADTPDSIYARYQMGPYSKGSFLAQLVDKLGIKITYTGAGGVTQTLQKSDWFE